MRPVLFNVSGVDDKEIPALLKTIEVCVVNGIAVDVGDDAVLRLIEVECKDVAGQDMLQKRDHVPAFDVDAAHMGNVEDAAVPAAVEMLGYDAVGVLDRHIPAAEVDHDRAGVEMCLIEYGSFQIAHVLPPFS